MLKSFQRELEEIYPSCCSFIEQNAWVQIMALCSEVSDPNSLPDKLLLHSGELGLPGFLPELARMELAFHKVSTGKLERPEELDQHTINPTLQLLQLSWKNLYLVLNQGDKSSSGKPEPGEEYVIVWQNPRTKETEVQKASEEDILSLKMIVEGITPEEVADAGNLPVGAVDAAIDRAVRKGLVFAPHSLIRRDPLCFPGCENTEERFLASPSFALQWHITQACDLHCKHCYDRSSRSSLKLDKAFGILDDMRAFCRSRNVKGHVTLTGGNPLLYPHFLEIYQGASDRGFNIAILGNPASRKQIEEILDIKRPTFFQVSLEGLQKHNDTIRGAGHFERVIDFLHALRDLKVKSMVMLTLTKDNIDQVLPLAEMLRDLTDDFSFNRLSMVGEGANLQLPSRDEYISFIEEYVKAAENNPIMDLKDNLIGIMLHNKGDRQFGGCAGFGCGAAFNFIAVLPDGQAHACRKFPSLIGNVFKQSIEEIYESDIAQRYRMGCKACQPCILRPVCGGCLAIAHSHGLDIFEDKDPYCFMNTSKRQ
ncbi:MAG: selenobiotic family peptide radical SAM maturase [Proteobacteria bacterium]|nr:selenobiotic family peptide radical SAM maturase [Desulfobacteraceae bacterium]MBU4014314.1 selenobiotic family peptide radical SAM maturase [Pseudomonadota bacterium]MBU4127296.1 selenobiotic family peptide radical SAM maturase [Pseudomonadota bacterium]